MEDILSPEIIQWIEENQWQDGMKETLSVSSDVEDERTRKLTIRLAIQWYQAYQNSLDGRNMPLELQDTIRKYVAMKNVEETIDDQVLMMWANMCSNAAEYRYAKLQPANEFTRALMAVYQSLQPEDVAIESIYTPVIKAIKKGLKKNPSTDKSHYGVEINGLLSTIVFPASDGIIPPNAHVWLSV